MVEYPECQEREVGVRCSDMPNGGAIVEFADYVEDRNRSKFLSIS